jgi:hypothetical protein
MKEAFQSRVLKGIFKPKREFDKCALGRVS